MGCGLGSHHLERHVLLRGDRCRGRADGGGLVAGARLRAEDRGVGLEEKRGEGQPDDELLLLTGAHDRRRNREGEAAREPVLGGGGARIEGVEEDAPGALLRQHLDHAASGGAGMDIERQVELEREPDLAAEDLLLELLPGRIRHLPVIEPHLADGRELAPVGADERRDLALGVHIEVGGIEPGARPEDRKTASEIENALRFHRRFSHAEDGRDAGGRGTLEHGGAVDVEGGVGQVGVAVHELDHAPAGGSGGVPLEPAAGAARPPCGPRRAALRCLFPAAKRRGAAAVLLPARRGRGAERGTAVMMPLRDINPSRTFPFVNITLIGLNVLAFLYELSLGPGLEQFIQQAAFIPSEYFAPGNTIADARSVLTSMFLHGGFMHLIGNMLYLWIFGDNLEDRFGHLRYLAFYLLSGWGATLAHAYLEPASTMPAIGASGAISGVLGAYLVLFPRARVLTLIPLGLYTRLTELPALVVLGFWFVLQLFSGMAALTARGAQAGGVAWWAHIGGFVIGIILGYVFAALRRDAPPPPRPFEPRRTF